MEYTLKFIIFYALLQIAVTMGGYFYYYSFIRKSYLKNEKLPWFIGFSQLFVFLFHGIILYLPYYLFKPWSLKNIDNVHSIIGLITISIAFIILFGGFINLGVFFKTMGTETGKLRTRGLYGITRNPQVLGYGLLLISCAIIWPSWYIVISLVSFCIIIHRMVLTEEIHLKNVFGQEYKEYCKHTPRYLFLHGNDF
ncbi:MAG: isoprenylcysteine carboxylmethyltransferase family protein [Bacteroidales bacterium]|nr:isoprenylcysteine carboxylmethyltransferase family protein [Bacteroidales bacterium]